MKVEDLLISFTKKRKATVDGGPDAKKKKEEEEKKKKEAENKKKASGGGGGGGGGRCFPVFLKSNLLLDFCEIYLVCFLYQVQGRTRSSCLVHWILKRSTPSSPTLLSNLGDRKLLRIILSRR